jgi:hypothetical protein
MTGHPAAASASRAENVVFARLHAAHCASGAHVDVRS